MIVLFHVSLSPLLKTFRWNLIYSLSVCVSIDHLPLWSTDVHRFHPGSSQPLPAARRPVRPTRCGDVQSAPPRWNLPAHLCHRQRVLPLAVEEAAEPVCPDQVCDLFLWMYFDCFWISRSFNGFTKTDVKSRGYYRAECEKLEYFKYFVIVLQLLQTWWFTFRISAPFLPEVLSSILIGPLNNPPTDYQTPSSGFKSPQRFGCTSEDLSFYRHPLSAPFRPNILPLWFQLDNFHVDCGSIVLSTHTDVLFLLS